MNSTEEAVKLSNDIMKTDSDGLDVLLECDLCFSLICEPISLSCGHSYCRLCIVQSLTRSKKQCPTCNNIIHSFFKIVITYHHENYQ